MWNPTTNSWDDAAKVLKDHDITPIKYVANFYAFKSIMLQFLRSLLDQTYQGQPGLPLFLSANILADSVTLINTVKYIYQAIILEDSDTQSNKICNNFFIIVLPLLIVLYA
jgi:hypothetical protein